MEARPADVADVRQIPVSRRCAPAVIELPIGDTQVKRHTNALSEQCVAEFAQSFPALFEHIEAVAVTQQ